MGVLLQAAYRRTVTRVVNGVSQQVNISVPAPGDLEVPDAPWWYDNIADQAKELASVGFSAILWPPVCKAQGGDGEGCDGYGVFDDYDVGSKNQQGSVNTRFGSRERFARACAIIKANGMQVYTDQVPHQRIGGNNGVYNYLGADGKTLNGRFNKTPSCFYGADATGKLLPGRVPRDPIAGPVADDASFGDELCPINALPKGYVMNGLISAGNWLFNSFDLDGARIDDVKGQAIQAVKNWATSQDMSGKFFVGEYDDGNPGDLNYYVWNQGLNGLLNVFDFTFHYRVEGMCNNSSTWDMTQLANNLGFVSYSPTKSVTFVESPDTDTEGASVIWNKVLGYALMLTSEGYPCVYYRDYSTDSGCYGLKPFIDNLIWIHEKLAGGDTIFRHSEYQFVVYERTGNPGLVVGINNDMSPTWKAVTIQTSKPNTHWHDYSGHNPVDCWSDNNGMLTFGIPPNNNGLGYVCFAPIGNYGSFNPEWNQTTQVFYGANDLDISPAVPKETIIVGRIWCKENSHITINERTRNAVGFKIIDASGNSISPINKAYLCASNGWYTITATTTNTIATDFELAVTYTSTQTLG